MKTLQNFTEKYSENKQKKGDGEAGRGKKLKY